MINTIFNHQLSSDDCNAFFQVNKWLNWLEEAESDSEEEDE